MHYANKADMLYQWLSCLARLWTQTKPPTTQEGKPHLDLKGVSHHGNLGPEAVTRCQSVSEGFKWTRTQGKCRGKRMSGAIGNLQLVTCNLGFVTCKLNL